MAQRWVARVAARDRVKRYPEIFEIYFLYSLAEPDETLADTSSRWMGDPISSAKEAEDIAAKFVAKVGGRRALIYQCKLIQRHGSEYTKEDDRRIEERFYRAKPKTNDTVEATSPETSEGSTTP